MKKTFLFLFILLVALGAASQKPKQKAFIDSCNKAISFYKDFLLKLDKGQSSFSKGKALFDISYNLLLELKFENEVPVDNEQYTLLLKGLESMKEKDFKDFLTNENKAKEKVPVNINGKTAILSLEHGVPFLIILDILKNKLEAFQ